jgi:M6 family metalloprotease-like protein
MRRSQVSIGTRTFALFGAAALALAMHTTALGGVSICNRPTDAPLPKHIVDAIERPDPLTPSPWGYSRLLQKVRENRKAVADGLMSQAEAESEGGVAITGVKGFPVLPFLYNNSGAAPYPIGSIEDELFTGPWPTGTMADYYSEVSYGLFTVGGGAVAPWTTLAQNDTYYEGSGNGVGLDSRIDEAIIEALDAQDPGIDFSQFDNDGPDGTPNSGDDDGYVDFTMFLSPDAGGECQTNNNIWSHAWFLSEWTGSYYETDDASVAPGVPNVRVDRYFVSAGLGCGGGQNGMGLTAHEFGHALGIKDLYDTTNQNSAGLGWWCLMAAGNWNTPDSPAHMCAWTKERLGWLSYFNATQNEEQLCLPPVETNPVAVRMWTNGAITPEYFVVENRQKIGFDQDLAGPGLVIYHVDEDVYDANEADNTVNGDEAHKAIDVECADATTAGHVANADELDTNANRGDADDPWCTDTQTEFTPFTIPDTRSYAGGATGVGVYGIGGCDGSAGAPPGWICASYDVGVPATTDLCMQDCSSDGCAEITNCDAWWGSPDLWIDNNDDGADDLPADGIDNHLWYRVTNDGPNPAANVDVCIYYSDPALGQLWPSTGTLIECATIPVIAPNETVEDFIVFNYPAPPALVDHYCIGAIAENSSDLQNSEFPPNDDNVAQVNHQVLVARAGGSEPSKIAGCPGPFDKLSKLLLMAAGRREGAVAELRRGTPPRFDDTVIPAGWTFTYDPGPHVIPANGAIDTYVRMSAPNATHGQTAYVPLTLWVPSLQKAIGGEIMEYRIDCYEPKAADITTIDCLPPNPDDLGGPSVKLAWDVQSDVNGNSEVVEYYEVFRGDNQGTPLGLYEKVAIDAEPGEAGFQWYDAVLFDSGYVYTYQVRAIDGAGSAGQFGAPINVTCTATGVASASQPSGSLLALAQPSPFGDATTIAYRVPQPGRVELSVYDVAGRRVRTLVDEFAAAGDRSLVWRGDNDAGEALASGVYFYKLSTPNAQEMRKVVIAR